MQAVNGLMIERAIDLVAPRHKLSASTLANYVAGRRGSHRNRR